MYYPGQPVYIPEDDTIGIFLGEDPSKNKSTANFQRPYTSKYTNFRVLVHTPGSENPVKLDVYEVDDLEPLIKEDPNTVTKQSIYYGPRHPKTKTNNGYIYRLPHWHSEMGDDLYNQMKEDYAKFLEELASEDWVLNQYLIPKKPVKQ